MKSKRKDVAESSLHPVRHGLGRVCQTVVSNQRWEVIKYIYLSTVFKYKFDLLNKDCGRMTDSYL